MTDTSTLTPPGYYDDGRGVRRWWDGSRWTARTEPEPAARTTRSHVVVGRAATGHSAVGHSAVGHGARATLHTASAPVPVRSAAYTGAVSGLHGPTRSPMPTIALVVGAVALALGLIPFVGFFSWIAAGTAIVLGFVAVARRYGRRRRALLGCGLGAAALVSGPTLALAWVMVFAGAHGDLKAALPAPSVAAGASDSIPAPRASAPVAALPAASDVRAKTWTGSGDRTLHVDYTSAVVMTFSCASCDGDVVVKTDSATAKRPVHAEGAYSGRHLLNAGDGETLTKLKVRADGDWTLKIEGLGDVQATTLDEPGKRLKGVGDDVFFVGRGVAGLHVEAKGEGDLVLRAWGAGVDSSDIVSETGPWTGDAAVAGPALVQVRSDGPWSVRGAE